VDDGGIRSARSGLVKLGNDIRVEYDTEFRQSKRAGHGGPRELSVSTRSSVALDLLSFTRQLSHQSTPRSFYGAALT